MPTAAVILPSATYRASDFVKAAEGLGVDLVIASDVPPPFDMEDRYLEIDCTKPETAAEAIVELGDRVRLDAVIAADDAGVITAAIAASRLGLLGNPETAARATRDKGALREALASGEVPQPAFRVLQPENDPEAAITGLKFPIVMKPLDRSAGQGVILATDIDDALERIEEVRGIVGLDPIIFEEFVDGQEVALEGIVRDSELTTLAILDKPFPLPGPYFAETILVTPSTLNQKAQLECRRVAQAAIDAVGIEHGPVHVEMIVSGNRVSIVEVAARSIGGLCSQSLQFGLMGTTLESLILRNSLGLDRPELKRERTASGVLMIPTPSSGTFTGVRNIDQVRDLSGISGIEMVVTPGTNIHPPPVGDRYLGFVFARGDTAERVTATLLAARERLEVVIQESPDDV